MAVDSKNKRASAANLPFMPIYPYPSSVVTSSDRMMASGEYIVHPWVSAAGHDSECEDHWDNCEYAHDDNTGTFAKEKIGDSSPLVLEWNAPLPRTDMIRIYAHDEDIIEGTHDASDVKIELYVNAVWTELCTFTFPEDVWYEYPIGQAIYGDRVRITSLDDEEYLNVAGFQFINLNAVMPSSIIPKAGGGLVRNSLLGSGLVT